MKTIEVETLMNRWKTCRQQRQLVFLIALFSGLCGYWPVWLTTLGVREVREDFFDIFPALWSYPPWIFLGLSMVLPRYPWLLSLAFFTPSLLAYHVFMLQGGPFALWPVFLMAHLAFLLPLTLIAVLLAWLVRRFLLPRSLGRG